MKFQLSHFFTILQLTILRDGIVVVAEKENSKNFSSSGRKKLYNAEDTDESHHHRRAKGLKSRKRNNRDEELAVCKEERDTLRDMLESTQNELKIAKDMSSGGGGGIFTSSPEYLMRFPATLIMWVRSFKGSKFHLVVHTCWK